MSQLVESKNTQQPSAGASKPLSVLILSPAPSVHGGVSVFIEMMKVHLRNCRISSLWVGSIQNRPESFITLITRLIVTPFKAAIIAKKQHFDVIHFNPTLDLKSVIRDGSILLLLRLMGFRQILVYFHGWQVDIQEGIARRPLLRQLFTWLLNGTALIMVLAPEFKEALESMGVTPEKVVFTRTMFDGASLNAVKNSLQPPTRRSILYMSRFISQKGVYELLDAFARIAPEYPDVDLIMAGGGPEFEGLTKRAAAHNLGDRVRFPGYVVGEEKFRMLWNCNVYTLPTYASEGMPVALLEAMGAGKPLLTAKAGVIPHIITDPENGVVLDNVTTDTVEAGLRRLLNNPDQCRETGKRNETYAWQRFEADSVTPEIEEFYRQIARKA